MNLYIKVENETVVGHPVLADNLKGILETSTLNDAIALEAGYYPFENAPPPSNTILVSQDGYEICSDEIVRNKYVFREMNQDDKVNAWIRPARETLLYRSDWTQATDAPLTATQKAAWATYRQELRDLPDQYPDLESASDIVWPAEPT